MKIRQRFAAEVSPRDLSPEAMNTALMSLRPPQIQSKARLSTNYYIAPPPSHCTGCPEANLNIWDSQQSI